MSKIFLSLFLLSPFLFGKNIEHDFHIQNQSQLLIHGKANIINFTCLLKNAFDGTPFKLKGKKEKQIIHLKEGKITIPIKNLDCGTRGMNKEMGKILQSKEHPNIVLDFIEYSIGDWKKSGRFLASSALSKIQITLAGESITYPIHLNLVEIDKKNYLMTGSKKLKMSDFNIKTKNYLFGLVKVNDLIEIDFELFLTK